MQILLFFGIALYTFMNCYGMNYERQLDIFPVQPLVFSDCVENMITTGCCNSYDVKSLMQLFDDGLHIDTESSKGSTFLRAAVICGDADVVTELLKRDADPFIGESGATAYDEVFTNFVHSRNPLTAEKIGNRIVRYLVDKQRYSSLHDTLQKCIQMYSEESVACIARSGGAAILTMQDDVGDTLLIRLARAYFVGKKVGLVSPKIMTIAGILLQHGADPDVINHKGESFRKLLPRDINAKIFKTRCCVLL